MGDELIVLVTTPEGESATTMARVLVEEKLAACVNVVPSVHSIYRWEGAVTEDREALMLIKTTVSRYEDLEARVKQLHSYSTPEVIAISIERGSAQYLKWIGESTG